MRNSFVYYRINIIPYKIMQESIINLILQARDNYTDLRTIQQR